MNEAAAYVLFSCLHCIGATREVRKKLSLEVKTPSLINELYEKRCKKFIFSIDLLRQAMKKRGNSFLKLNFTALANEMK